MKRSVLYIVAILLVSNIGFSQSACFTFESDSISCFPNPLIVKVKNCSGSNILQYDFGDGDGFQDDSTYTYTQPGTYTITQAISVGGAANFFTRQVKVIIRKPPVYEIERCEGNTLNFTFNDPDASNYSMVMGDGNIYFTIPPTSTISHTYPDNSPRNITIQASYGPSCNETRDTTVIPLAVIQKPDISRVTVNDQNTTGQVTVTFNALADQQYYVQESVDGGAYTNIDTLRNLTGIQNLVYSNRNTAASRYCYRLVSYDDCIGIPLVSEEICTTIPTVTASNNQNDISWSAHSNAANYHVYKDGTLLTSLPAGQTTYSDAAINCGVNYCYEIIGELTQTDGLGNNLETISATQCVTGISTTTPSSIQNLNSTLVNGVVQITWDTPTTFSVEEYHLSRSVNGGSYSPYTNLTNNLYLDNAVSYPENTYCYTVDYTDNCGNNSSPGGTTCPIVLDVTVDNSNNNMNHLSWTPYTGQWPGGIQEYQVEVLDEGNNIINTVNAGITFSYSDLVSGTDIQLIRYRIKAVANGGPEVSYSNIVEIRYEGQIFLPNAFSPNGDNNNDVFLPKGQFVKDYKLTIYNRWGEVVFSTDQIETGWDGNYLGTPATADAYAYLVEVSDLWGKVITKRGSVTLLR